MADLREIYQEVILDHYRKPRNYAALSESQANRKAGGHNPLCGDRMTVYLVIDDGVVQEASFEGAGCAISTASASLMTEAVKGKPLEEVKSLFERFHGMLTNAPELAEDNGLGKLEALAGVRQVPVRIKCATLAWHTLKAALESSGDAVEAVTTE